MAQKQYSSTVVEKKRVVTGIEDFSLRDFGEDAGQRPT